MSNKIPAPTPEEIAERLKAAGQKAGVWGEMGGKDVRPMFLDEQTELANKLLGALKQQEALLSAELSQAREAMHKIKHGGGA